MRTAFYEVQADLRRIGIFHTGRGSEFKDQIIDGIIDAFGIARSISAKGTPIGNAVAESMYSIVKTGFAYGEGFADYPQLDLRWFDYVNRYSNVRIHGSLGYVTPSGFERLHS
ncbi:integrase core domain-containing protein [Lachnospiraceae bacterium ZAX-1]